MCFSATASFTASAVLGAVGAATLVRTKNRRFWLLSALPLFFALQQFLEGLLWLSLTSWPSHTLALTYIYLFFALLWWPIYVPLMILSLEPIKIRRIILAFFCVAGAITGSMLFVNFLNQPQAAKVINQCLYYPERIFYPEILKYLYVLVVIGCGLVSSRPIAKLFCLFVFIASIITYFYYWVNFTSVWCFFAAIISLVIFFQPQKSDNTFAS